MKTVHAVVFGVELESTKPQSDTVADRAVQMLSEKGVAAYTRDLEQKDGVSQGWPPILPGTFVETTRENPEIDDWGPEARLSRQWGVLGEVLTHHDSHGLSYEVKHPDGTIGHYDPTEFRVVV